MILIELYLLMRFHIVYYADFLSSNIPIYYFNHYNQYLDNIIQSFCFNTQIKKKNNKNNENNSKLKFKERTFLWQNPLQYAFGTVV